MESKYNKLKYNDFARDMSADTIERNDLLPSAFKQNPPLQANSEIANGLERSRRVQNVPERHRALNDRVEKGSAKEKDVIKLNCLRCSSYNENEIRECRVGQRCAIWMYRPFQQKRISECGNVDKATLGYVAPLFEVDELEANSLPLSAGSEVQSATTEVFHE